MRFNAIIRSFYFWILIVAAVAFAGVVGQSSAQEDSNAKHPSLEPAAANDPAAVLLLDAAQHVGLGEISGAPLLAYKLKAIFEVVSPDGSVTDRGRYEAIFKDDSHSRITYESTGFTQVAYWNSDHGRATGSRAALAPDPYRLIISALYYPIYFSGALRRALVQERHTAIQSESRTVAGKPARCYELSNTEQVPYRGPWATYCFNGARALVQFTFGVRGTDIATVSRTIEYQGRQIPAEVEMKRNGSSGLRIHVESIGPVNESDAALFVAPPEAVALDPIVLPVSSPSSVPK
jgi:hypothetical protein